MLEALEVETMARKKPQKGGKDRAASKGRRSAKAKQEVQKSKKMTKPSKKAIRISYDEVSKWKTIAIIFFLLFMITFVYSKKPAAGGQVQGDELIYITSSACGSCEQYQQVMQHIADVLGTSYRQVEYINPVTFPGFVLIRNGTLALAGFNDKVQLLNFMCQLTSNQEICEEYNAELNKNVNKTDVPVVKFFVMSFCPFGQQMEQVIKQVYDLLGDKAIFEPHFVVYSGYGGYPDYCLDEDERYCSLHGIQELHEDVRQLCIWKYYNSSVWWDYVMKINENCNAENVDDCWADIASSLNIDVDKINTCSENEATDLLEQELSLNKQYDVRGSPTVFINDQLYRGERTARAFKQAVCAAFNEPPAECNQDIAESSSQTKSSNTPSGSCG